MVSLDRCGTLIKHEYMLPNGSLGPSTAVWLMGCGASSQTGAPAPLQTGLHCEPGSERTTGRNTTTRAEIRRYAIARHRSATALLAGPVPLSAVEIISSVAGRLPPSAPLTPKGLFH